MLSTVQIVSGADGTPWTRDQRECVLEIRSEHKLDDPTTFGILMADLPDRPDTRAHRLLAEGRMVAVLVRARASGSWTVLFQGTVTEVETSETQGGVGSTILYRGKDIRTRMAGRSFRGAWSGRVKDVMEHLIKLDFPDCEVHAPENNTLDPEENPLGQNSNNLEFLRTQAIAYGHNLWVSYAQVPEGSASLGLEALDASGPRVTITPKIHWARSPYLEAKLGNLSIGEEPPLPVLGGDDSVSPTVFKVHLGRQACPNVTKFEVITDGPSVAVMEPEPAARNVPLDVPAPLQSPLGATADADGPVIYFVPPAVQQTEADEAVNVALETARGFNRRVRLSTTKAMLQKICLPHDLAGLEGVDPALGDKLFRISEALHVIRLDRHFMDVVLETDGTVPLEGSESLLSAAAEN
jgi:hypothetical protein